MDYHLLTASPIGFEPTTSCVTGKRALRCSTRTNRVRRESGDWRRESFLSPDCRLQPLASSSSSGGTRTHSISGSKPKWSANCLPSHEVRCLGRRGLGCRKNCIFLNSYSLNSYSLETYSLLQSGAPGNRTPIFCLQNRCPPVGRAPRRRAWSEEPGAKSKK